MYRALTIIKSHEKTQTKADMTYVQYWILDAYKVRDERCRALTITIIITYVQCWKVPGVPKKTCAV